MDDMISRRAAIDAICKDGIQRERQGQYSITMVDRKYLDTEILEALPSAQTERDDCDTCKHGYFGSVECNNCRVRYPSHWESREGGQDNGTD